MNISDPSRVVCGKKIVEKTKANRKLTLVGIIPNQIPALSFEAEELTDGSSIFVGKRLRTCCKPELRIIALEHISRLLQNCRCYLPSARAPRLGPFTYPSFFPCFQLLKGKNSKLLLVTRKEPTSRVGDAVAMATKFSVVRVSRTN